MHDPSVPLRRILNQFCILISYCGLHLLRNTYNIALFLARIETPYYIVERIESGLIPHPHKTICTMVSL